MRRSSRLLAAWCGMLFVGSPALAQSCDKSDCGPAPKVVVHLPTPEVVYENSASGSGKVKHCLFKRHRSAAPVTQAAAFVMPNAFVGQQFDTGFTATALALQGFNVQAMGPQNQDFSELHAAHQLELMTARLQSFQAARQAEAKVHAESFKRIQAHIAGLQSFGTGSTQGLKEGNCATKDDVAELKKKIEDLAADIKVLKDDVKKLQKPN